MQFFRKALGFSGLRGTKEAVHRWTCEVALLRSCAEV